MRPARSFALEERGQAVVMIGLMLSMLMALVGLAVDISWYQMNLSRIQRAADAGALAGVVFLPGNPTGAINAARAETKKNGYANGVGGVTVTPQQDASNNKIMIVTVDSPVPTLFMRLMGISTVQGSRRARAEFILPVPMGSPQDYYGIYRLCEQSGACNSVNKAPGLLPSPLTSQGFWGGILTKGGQHSNGDAYSPFYNGGTNPNAEYDPNGYSYTVEMPGGTVAGEVWLFDATFCATGHGGGTYLGVGDHWIGTGGTPVTLQYRLWDTKGTPYALFDDELVSDSGSTFFSLNQVDKGPKYKGDGRYSDGGYTGGSSADCQSDPHHNAWYKLAGLLGTGTYRMQVTTSHANNNSTNAENNFGIQVLSTVGAPRVYGSSRMVAYTNVVAGNSLFYLAQVDDVHAGKVLEMRLFDPGDVGGNAFLRIKKPTSTGYVDATFSFTAAGGSGPQSGTNVTSLQTAASGSSRYQNAWVTISVPLPANYGVGGLTPPGETEAGWWKIEYQVTAAGNDTTTWEANIRGNPVHLIIP
jgi:Flp pilus assembly protein TadG